MSALHSIQSSLRSPLGQLASLGFALAVLYENRGKIKSLISRMQPAKPEQRALEVHFSKLDQAKFTLAALLVMQSFDYRSLHIPFNLIVAPLAYSVLTDQGLFSNMKKIIKPVRVLSSIAITNFILGHLPLAIDFRQSGTLSKIINFAFMIFTVISLGQKAASSLCQKDSKTGS